MRHFQILFCTWRSTGVWPAYYEAEVFLMTTSMFRATEHKLSLCQATVTSNCEDQNGVGCISDFIW